MTHTASLHPLNRKPKGFTLMEILVVIAIIIVLAAIAFPVIITIQKKSYKAEALKRMQDLGQALGKYAQDHDGAVVDEDASGKDDWSAMAKPEADKAWYNALPQVLGAKRAGDFVKESITAKFYTKENILFLPGAQYPQSKKAAEPLFAIGMNSKLHRKEKTEKKKPDLKMSNIQFLNRTVAFMEKGLPGEERAHETISKKDYDGSCKGNGKSFVARYGGKGVITFFDGHAEDKAGKDLLQPTGELIWDPADPSCILWAADPTVNPE